MATTRITTRDVQDELDRLIADSGLDAKIPAGVGFTLQDIQDRLACCHATARRWVAERVAKGKARKIGVRAGTKGAMVWEAVV